MSLRVHLTLESSNSKTGPIPVSTTSADSCPPSCPLKKAGCYANGGPLALHWREVTEGRRGTDWETFCSKIAALPEGTLWRHNQAGDLPGRRGVIDKKMMCQLIEANRGRYGFTYTHYPMTKANREIVLLANQNGFTVNLSAHSLQHADRLAALGIAPVATLVLDDCSENTETPHGREVLICPAQLDDEITCLDCGGCADVLREPIIGFLPHGCQRISAEKIAMKNEW